MFTAIIIALLVIRAGIWYVESLQAGKQIIRNGLGETYLERYFIWRPDWLDRFGIDSKKAGRIYLHHIIRNDYERALHDHPWPFLSVMVKGRYREYTTFTDMAKNVKLARGEWNNHFVPDVTDPSGNRFKLTDYVHQDFRAPAILRRPAQWRHRLEVLDKQGAWTLVFVGPKVRSWGFWTTLSKWCYWKHFNDLNNICEEPELEMPR